jgi:hypothetical protein
MATSRTAARALCAALAAAAAGGLGACRDDDAEAVRTTAVRFHAAVAAHQGAVACRELTDAAVDELETSRRRPCARAVLRLGLDAARPLRERVFENNASVDLTGGQTVFLDHTDEGWRISAAGCEPRHEQPYDCELEG